MRGSAERCGVALGKGFGADFADEGPKLAEGAFTASVLADMVTRGEVRLDDPVAKYLPDSAHVPSRNGKQITLLDLATDQVEPRTEIRAVAARLDFGSGLESAEDRSAA